MAIYNAHFDQEWLKTFDCLKKKKNSDRIY